MFYIAGIVVAALYVLITFWPGKLKPYIKMVQQSKQLRASGAVIHIEEDEPEPSADACAPIPVDEVKAGQILTSVPTYNASKEGSWQADRTVVCTAMAKVFTPQGAQDTLFIWLSGDMLLMKTPTKWRLLTELPISGSEAQTVLDERESLLKGVKAGASVLDQSIDSFRGCAWKINGSYGRNDGGKFPGQSTIERTSVISDTGQFADDLPSLAKGQRQAFSYFDMRADFVSGDPTFTDRCMVAFWLENGADCVVYVGKYLDEADVRQMGVM